MGVYIFFVSLLNEHSTNGSLLPIVSPLYNYDADIIFTSIFPNTLP